MELTQRQEDILQAAISLIAREGFRHFTVKNMAKELKTSESELYRHFSGKEQVIEAILNYFDDLSDLILVEIEAAELEPLEKVHRFILDRYQLFSVQNELTMAMFSVEMHYYDHGSGQRMSWIVAKHRNFIVSCLKEAQAQGLIDPSHDPMQLFRILIGSTRFLIAQWNACGQEFDLVEEGEKLLHSIWNLIIVADED